MASVDPKRLNRDTLLLVDTEDSFYRIRVLLSKMSVVNITGRTYKGVVATLETPITIGEPFIVYDLHERVTSTPVVGITVLGPDWEYTL